MEIKHIKLVSEMLSAPFAEDEINWRVQNSRVTGQGEIQIKVVPYLDARQVEQRLDDILTIARWTVSYQQIEGGFLATIGIYFGDPVGWVYRTDGAEETNIEATKGGISDAFKRAAVQFGIGRYLYVPAQKWNQDYLGEVVPNGKYHAKVSAGGKQTWVEWNPPQLRKPTGSYIGSKPPKSEPNFSESVSKVFDEAGKKSEKFSDHPARVAKPKQEKEELGIF